MFTITADRAFASVLLMRLFDPINRRRNAHAQR